MLPFHNRKTGKIALSVIITLMSHIIAVDIGGTHIRAAAFEPDSIKPLSHKRAKTLASEPGVFDRLVHTIETVWQKDVAAIGIASPGPPGNISR